MTLLYPPHSSLQWTLIQKFMLHLSYASFWTRSFEQCFKTTVCRSEIVLSQCHQHDSRQQKNTSTWIFLLQLSYFLESLPQRPCKAPSSHTTRTCFCWWQDVPGQKPTSYLDAPSNIQIYGTLDQGAQLGELRGSLIIATSPIGCPGIKSLRPILYGW